jgi:cob(I)alamin adenosyltransferase
MKIYTGKGDDGSTSLSGGRRVPKHHVRVEAYGTIDELIAWIALLSDQEENANRKDILSYIQKQLMASVVVLSSDNANHNIKKMMPDDNCVSVIEAEIDKMEAVLSPLKNFILPGGKTIVSYCHITRCVCRRAERAVSLLNDTEYSPEIIQIFLNRLSDFLFVLSRKLCLELGIEEHTS